MRASLLLIAVAGVAGAQEPPDLERLAQRGREGLARLEAAGAVTWTATHEVGGGRLVVQVVQAEAKRLSTLSQEIGGRRQELLRLLATETRWYLCEGDRRVRSAAACSSTPSRTRPPTGSRC